jgi:hypothetical protein
MLNHEGNNRYLRLAKIIQILLLIAILLYVDIIYRWSIIPLISQDIGLDKSTLNLITIVIAFFGIICLVYGYFIPIWMTKTLKQKSQPKWRKWLSPHSTMTGAESMSLTVYITRSAMFVGIAVYGLVLGILGVGWQITLPFFVASAIALVLTFPTKKRWKRMLDKFSGNNTPTTKFTGVKG